MRRLPTIVVLSLTFHCVDAAAVATAQPVCFSCGLAAAATVKRDGFVLARGGMGGGGGGMHCGVGCGGARGGMGGSGGGMGGSGGGMGGSGGGMGGALGGLNPFIAPPHANCSGHRRPVRWSLWSLALCRR
jgi:hypothetical protein